MPNKESALTCVLLSVAESQEARFAEFSTNQYDKPLIVQFAAKSGPDLATAAQYVKPYCDGIDINCGCPQRWVIGEGFGCALLRKPELVSDMVKHASEASGVPCSIKIRISDDMRETVELAQRAERMGTSWVTVHGRTRNMRSTHPVNYEAVKMVKEHMTVPVFGNGNCFTLADAKEWQSRTGVDGVMAARGLLQNPALFAGYDTTPMDCVMEFLDIALKTGMPSHTIHQHLMYMLYSVHSKAEKQEFNSLRSTTAILDFFERRGVEFKSVDLSIPRTS